VQKERFKSQQEFETAKGSYGITTALLRHARPDTLVMHPLPRVDELAYEVDTDPRAAYFRQAAYGLPVRMALLAAILGKKKAKTRLAAEVIGRPADVDLTSAGVRCENPRCITTSEAYLRARFAPAADATLRSSEATSLRSTRRVDIARCYYCGRERSVRVPRS
jgi:aspartate carbamoyltransferase catalytic subunit